MKTKYKLDFKVLPSTQAVFFIALIACCAHAFAGSLWREAVTDERGMFSDKRARRVGDILTVVLFDERLRLLDLNDTTRIAANGSAPGLGTNLLNQFIAGITSRDRARMMNGGTSESGVPNLNYDPRFPTNLLPRNQSEVQGILARTGKSLPAVDTSTSNETNYERRLRSQIAVQVIDVLPNGNLVIEGQRTIGFGPERMIASLRGIARPYDITSQNTVPSTLVADVRIDYVPEGSFSFAGKQGWLQKIDEKISPW
jgi:flagellar L-ring protein precursor FlgH